MKAISSIVLILAICSAMVIPAPAAGDKLLQNVKGTVSYQGGSGAATPVAPNATVALADNDYAITGDASQAAIQLPDSSKVLVGQNTKVQLAFFDQQPNITTAKFVLYQGKTRFTVEHPSGAKANYTFQTSAGQIAVRGTEGDISTTQTQLQVNVYQLTDPNLPVQVTLTNGKTYNLKAGQGLIVGVAGAVIAAAAVSGLSQTMVGNFAEFGAPANSAGAAGAVGAAGAAGSAAAPAVAAGAAAAAAAGVVVASTNKGKATSSPSATPSPTPTPVPTPTPTPTPGPISGLPSSVTLSPATLTATFAPSETNYSGTFTATSSSAGVVAVSPASGTLFTLKAKRTGGPVTITVNGAPGATGSFQASVSAGKVTLGTTSATTVGKGGTVAFTVGEPGYRGSFTPTSSTSNFTVPGSSSGSFTATAGSTTGQAAITATDALGNTSNAITLQAFAGPITFSPSALGLTIGKSATFQASESGYRGSFAATGNAYVGVTSSASSGGFFTATGRKATTSTSITVSDAYNNSSNLPVSVSPSPGPSTTCVPIIISLRKHEKPAAAPTCSPEPTLPPGSTLRHGKPKPQATVAPPQPHPVGPPPPAKPPETARTPAPRAPAPPPIPGMQQPPAMPGLPPAKRRGAFAYKAEAVVLASAAIKRVWRA
ncbi:MAG TPA: FecR domain-containing protein [Verrucomicrobiae bacterium]|nr:FecR domain-containing protein [Verrucomicrobiae bacterium]